MSPSSLPPELVLGALLAASDEGVVACDPEGRVRLWSAGAERLLGYPAAEAVGRPLEHFLSGAEAAPGEPFAAEGRARGGPVPLWARLVALPGGAGRLALLRAAQAPEADQLGLALQAGRLGDYRWDAATDLMTLSPRAAELYGVPPGQPLPRSAMRALLHPDDREPARQAAEAAVAGRSDYVIEYRVRQGARERWLAVSGRHRFDAAGRVVGMYGVVQELTNDRLLLRVDDAVRALARPEDITFTAARLLGQHLGVNRCAYAFVEEDQDTFLLTGNYTDGVGSIVGRYRFRQFGAECLRLMRAGLPWVVEDSGADPRLDAEDRAAYRLTAIRGVICVPIRKAGRFVAAMAVHTHAPRRWAPAEVELVQQVASRCGESIERARVEQEREGLLEAARAANRAKDEFLAMLGHELRNPLAPITTALQLMRLRGDAASGRERETLERQVRHLTRLVDDLLDVARIARGKVALAREPVELAAVVAPALEVAAPLLQARGHTLELALPEAGLRVEGDPDRLTQVVSNLLTNAAKYTPPGGRVAVRAAAEGGEAVLRVQDSGIGMAPEVLPRVFDLFVQGPQALDRAQGGLGLGLSIVKSLVERHGGRVSARSAGPGRGSEFEVRLPLARPGPAAPAPAPQAAPAPEAAPGLRVLVVDDNVDAAELLADVLSLKGCRVEVAHDGAEALRRAAAAPGYDAALLDIGLPVMDGYELVGRLRALPALGGARLVAVTGYGQEADRRRALDAGFHQHLVKPLDFPTLDALLADLRR